MDEKNELVLIKRKKKKKSKESLGRQDMQDLRII